MKTVRAHWQGPIAATLVLTPPNPPPPLVCRVMCHPQLCYLGEGETAGLIRIISKYTGSIGAC